MISNVGIKGTSDPDDYWPTTPYTQVLSVDEYSYARFHCVLMKTFSTPGVKKIGYQVFDSQGTLVHEHESELEFKTTYDRYSMFWTINPTDSVPAAAGKYTVLMWIEDSRAFEFTFRLTSAFEEEEEKRNSAIEDTRTQITNRIHAETEIKSIERKLSYPKLARHSALHFILTFLALGMLSLMSANQADGIGATVFIVLVIAVWIVYIISFRKLYKKTLTTFEKGKLTTFFIVLIGSFYLYPLIMGVLALGTRIQKKKLTARLAELKQMLD